MIMTIFRIRPSSGLFTNAEPSLLGECSSARRLAWLLNSDVGFVQSNLISAVWAKPRHQRQLHDVIAVFSNAS